MISLIGSLMSEFGGKAGGAGRAPATGGSGSDHGMAAVANAMGQAAVASEKRAQAADESYYGILKEQSARAEGPEERAQIRREAIDERERVRQEGERIRAAREKSGQTRTWVMAGTYVVVVTLSCGAIAIRARA